LNLQPQQVIPKHQTTQIVV